MSEGSLQTIRDVEPTSGGLGLWVFRLRSAILVAVVAPIPVWAVFGGGPIHAGAFAGGVVLVLVAAALRLAACRQIGKHARVRRAGAARLCQEGPFGFTRNPLYVANVLLAGGFALQAGGGLGALAVAAGAVATYTLVARYEERVLAATFGAAYEDYRARVPRWLGVVRPRSEEAAAEPPAPEAAPWSWGHVVRREWTLFVGLPVGVATVLAARTGVVPVAGWLDVATWPLGLPGWGDLLAGVLIGAVVTGVHSEVKRRNRARRRARQAEGRPS